MHFATGIGAARPALREEVRCAGTLPECGRGDGRCGHDAREAKCFCPPFREALVDNLSGRGRLRRSVTSLR